jgi:hypothetical protein
VYEVDERDRVVELPEAPQSDTGAPTPVLVAEEDRLEVAYRAFTGDGENPDWGIAVARFRMPRAHTFGSPNDEAFEGHPLAARGLAPYGAYRIEDSSWIRRLERMNSVHYRHDPERFRVLNHYILSFHDSTFECVAEGVVFSLVPEYSVHVSLE